MDEYREDVLGRATGSIDLTAPACAAAPAFAALPQSGRSFIIDTAGQYFVGKRRWRYHEKDIPGWNRADNHFQGVQRKGDHLFITGGDWNEPAAHLFVAELRTDVVDVPVSGRLVRIISLGGKSPHPGGIQRLGDLLGVPLEGGKHSAVRFLCIENPADPTSIGGASTIVRREKKASAVALARLGDDRLLVGVAFQHSLDLYLSLGGDIADGYVPERRTSRPHGVRIDLDGIAARRPAYQAIHFFAPEPVAAIDGGGVMVPMIAFRNTRQSLSNWYDGQDLADLIEIRLPQTLLDDWTGGAAPLAAHAATPREFLPGRYDGNFSAAAGVDVYEKDRIRVYAVHHWRTDEGIRATVFG